MDIIVQTQWLFLLAIPVATISWTITHEEIFREAKEFCVHHSKENHYLLVRKFFYLFTCEYCFSHYIAALAIVSTGFKLLMPDWRGYIIAGFAVVWVANVYMGLYQIIRLTLKKLQLSDHLLENKVASNTVPEAPKEEEELNAERRDKAGKNVILVVEKNAHA